ncbi:hypothetical protein AYO20_08870 [Fonsecaea nubica]|uniref:ABC multidrug transporter MDR2 n=1 Tax=Fonsecaea nubica TaxID=856822 RepID=A0A178CLC1_9EURO|nr:hypothetical protein AYO20_08870 [Fonsecaea nubica]OAL30154.1 hypothetical protein AYO20_08870 [Fonsecaea nubica]
MASNTGATARDDAIQPRIITAQHIRKPIRWRDEAPFLWLSVITFLVAVAELIGLIVLRTNGISKFHSLAVATLYVLAFLVQLSHLLPTPVQANDDKIEPSWHAFVEAWTLMILSDVLAIFDIYTRLDNDATSTPNSPTSPRMAAPSPFSIATTTTGKGSSAQQRNKPQSKKRKCSPTLRRNVSEEIRGAGGRWQWMKKFRIFVPWVWPSQRPWMKVHIVCAIIVLGTETLLSLYASYVQGAFVQSVVQAYTAQHLSTAWKPPALVVVVQFAYSSSGLSAVRTLLWAKFKLGRKAKVRKLVYEHLMSHEAAFHNSTDRTDISTAIEKSNQVFSLVLGAVSAVELLLVLWANRNQTVIVDRATKTRFGTNRLCQGGLRGWSTVAMYDQIDREIGAYGESLGAQTEASLLSSFGAFAATTLVIVRGLQTGDHTVAPVVAFGGYMALAKGPMRHLTRIPEHIMEDLYNADHLRRLLEIVSKMKYGPKNLTLDVGGGTIEFKNVTFGYPSAADGAGNKTTLKHFSLVSTIIDLVKRSYDPDVGTIHIDGQDIKELQKRELSKYISVMAQTPYLFNHTFSPNIKYGRPDATETELHDAADRAGIHDMVQRSPGEKPLRRRKNNELRWPGHFSTMHPSSSFDEATSALDADTEAHVKESIKSNKTTIVIAYVTV